MTALLPESAVERVRPWQTDAERPAARRPVRTNGRRHRNLVQLETTAAELRDFVKDLIARIHSGEERGTSFVIVVTDAKAAAALGLDPAESYHRLSKDDQNGTSESDEVVREKDSLPRQVENALEACETRKLVLTRLYIDNDITAWSGRDGGKKSNSRAGLNALRRNIENGEVRNLLVRELNRLFRDMVEGSAFVKSADANGCRIISVFTGDAGTDAMGMLLTVLNLWSGQKESETASQRQLDKQATLAKEGKVHGGQRPIGYQHRKTAGGTENVPDPVEAPVIAEAVRQIVEEKRPSYLLGDDLYAIGVYASDGGRLHANSVMRILRSPRICGWRVRNAPDNATWREFLACVVRDASGNPIQAWDPIVSPEMWLRLQEELDSRSVERAPRQVTALRRLPVCDNCGGFLYGGNLKKGNQVAKDGVPYGASWTCNNARRGKCDKGAGVNSAALERLLLKKAKELLAPGVLEAAERALVHEQAQAEAGVATVTEQLVRAKAELEELQEFYKMGMYEGATGKQMFASKFRELTARIDDLKVEELKGATTAAPNSYIEQLRQLNLDDWVVYTSEEKNTIFRILFDRVVVRKASARGFAAEPLEERVTVYTRLPGVETI